MAFSRLYNILLFGMQVSNGPDILLPRFHACKCLDQLSTYVKIEEAYDYLDIISFYLSTLGPTRLHL